MECPTPIYRGILLPIRRGGRDKLCEIFPHGHFICVDLFEVVGKSKY